MFEPNFLGRFPSLPRFDTLALFRGFHLFYALFPCDITVSHNPPDLERGAIRATCVCYTVPPRGVCTEYANLSF